MARQSLRGRRASASRRHAERLEQVRRTGLGRPQTSTTLPALDETLGGVETVGTRPAWPRRPHFSPEPGTLILLGSGVAGLVLLGHLRMRK
jgi:hypothetical protein